MFKLKLFCIIFCIAFCNCKPTEQAEDYINTGINKTAELPGKLTYEYINTEAPSNNATSETSGEFHIRINGGRPVEQIVPYQVSLQRFRRRHYEHMCGGCIISAHHVLTAAHCLVHVKANEITVVVGTALWREGGDHHRVIDMRTHQGFSMYPIIMNDIAILKVWPPFNLGKSSIGILALGGMARVGENVPVRLTGWGSMMPASIILPETLQMLDYRTISNQECAQRGSRITARELCALGERGRGACLGDSGGPLITLLGTPQLVGIVSHGSPVCAQGEPDVYTRVSSFLPYINRVITSEMP